MHIQVKWFNEQFNIELASKEGTDPFLSVKGCRIINGQKGPFVSYPATKKQDGKYWNHAYGSDKFNAEVLRLAEAEKPQQKAKRQEVTEDDEDLPF